MSKENKSVPATQIQASTTETSITADDYSSKRKRLDELKKQIHKLTDNFIQVVLDLEEIKRDALWKLETDDNGRQIFNTFESFMDSEFGFKRAYYSRLHKASDAYKWLEENNPKLQSRITVVRPAFYEALDNIPEEDRIDTLQKLLEDKTQKQKGASLTRIWKRKQKDLEKTEVAKQIEIAIGILKRIDIEKINDSNLPKLSNEDIEKIKAVIEHVAANNGKSTDTK